MTRIGTILENKYEILKKIGQGGMSVVYLAMDIKLNKQWAVKEIKKEASGKHNEIIVQSLLAEANLMKRLDHPALPRIVDIIENDETICVVMDYIEGESLDRIFNEQGAQPQELVIEWGKQLCMALQYLHNQSPAIIYRDMKPANVMLKPEGNLKIIDFGIAREFKEQNMADTISLGTKGYAAPEQFGGKGQTDARTDIYCLGVTLYSLVTGHDPCEPPYELYPIRHWDASLSSGLERIIQKCTQLNPNDRYQSCAELLYALDHYEKIDDQYKRIQRKKLNRFSAATVACALMLIVGITTNLLAANETNNNYQVLIDISTATDYNTKIATYEEAIRLVPRDTRAYTLLLQAYKDNGVFGDTESGQFLALYNEYQSQFDTREVDYLDLCYDIGTTYWHFYSGGDNSFRTRILKSHPYFKTIVDTENDQYSLYAMAQSYYIIGQFYSQYVLNTTSVKEPAREAYDELIDSLKICIENMEYYSLDDGAFIKLSVYQEISNLLNDHRNGFAMTGVDKAQVLYLLGTVYERASALSVTQPKSVSIQHFIQENYEGYRDAIERAYRNAGERP